MDIHVLVTVDFSKKKQKVGEVTLIHYSIASPYLSWAEGERHMVVRPLQAMASDDGKCEAPLDGGHRGAPK